MTVLAPEPWQAALLTLAAFRCWWLLANDAILNPVRDRVVKRWPSESLATFMDCPWCSGAWISVAWWCSWLAWEDWSVWVAVPFALSAAVGIIGMTVDRLASD